MVVIITKESDRLSAALDRPVLLCEWGPRCGKQITRYAHGGAATFLHSRNKALRCYVFGCHA